MTTEPTTAPKPRRRWLQFSLRTLLVLMLVFGCGFGWLAYRVQRVREQREAVRTIEEMGGRGEYQPASGSIIRTAVTWVGKLLGEDLSGDVTGVGLPGPQVSDAGLTHLRGLTQLQDLSLSSTQVSDAGLVHLRGLTQLQGLSLINTQVTDAGLEHLRGLTELQLLDLSSTPVTDAGLVHLRGLTQLRELSLNGTLVTDAGVAKLQKALPNMKIERSVQR